MTLYVRTKSGNVDEFPDYCACDHCGRPVVYGSGNCPECGRGSLSDRAPKPVEIDGGGLEVLKRKERVGYYPPGTWESWRSV